MGVSYYNRLSTTDSGYTKYGSTTRADFQSKITPAARYSRPTSKGISRTKGRDQEVTKRSSAITATTSYTSASSARASSASFTLSVNQSQGATAAKLV
jgi:hypothetical protein